MRKIRVTLETETTDEAKRLVAHHLGCTTQELSYELLKQTAAADTVRVWCRNDESRTAILLVPTWSR